MRKWSVISIALVVIFLLLSVHPSALNAQSWFEVLIDAIKESVEDSANTFNEEYGKGATDSLRRGPEGMGFIEGYRGRINSLFAEGKIQEAERDRRLQTLFASYDAYKDGRISRYAFEQYAEKLTEP